MRQWKALAGQWKTRKMAWYLAKRQTAQTSVEYICALAGGGKGGAIIPVEANAVACEVAIERNDVVIRSTTSTP